MVVNSWFDQNDFVSEEEVVSRQIEGSNGFLSYTMLAVYGEEKRNLNVMKGVSIRTGGVELTKGCRELAGAWGCQ